MDVSAFQLCKHSERTNANARLHDTPIVQYGRIIKVIDIQTVVVEVVIQTSLAKEVYTVTLLNLSSALLEINAWPKLGDTVLMLFLQRYDPRMFVYETVKNPNATGYNKFSGVGILASTVKGLASTLLQLYEDDGKPAASMRSCAKWLTTFNAELALTFCRLVFNSDDEALISMTFGEGRPFMQRFLSTVTKEYGFWPDTDGNLIPVDANAAVTEKYSQNAPITKDIQGTQDYKIGIDKDGNATPAVVHVEIGENADITLSSESGLAVCFKRAVFAESEDTITLKAGDKVHIGNSGMDIHTLLMDLVSEIKALQTFGQPSLHKVHPGSLARLTAYEQKIDALFTPDA